jgi:hypothetical protein
VQERLEEFAAAMPEVVDTVGGGGESGLGKLEARWN